jgi:hypothetical protein
MSRPLVRLGRDEVTRTNRGRQRHKRLRTFLLIFREGSLEKYFLKIAPHAAENHLIARYLENISKNYNRITGFFV